MRSLHFVVPVLHATHTVFYIPAYTHYSGFIVSTYQRDTFVIGGGQFCSQKKSSRLLFRGASYVCMYNNKGSKKEPELFSLFIEIISESSNVAVR